MVSEDEWWAPVAFFWAIFAILVTGIFYNPIIALALCGIVSWMWRRYKYSRKQRLPV